MQTSCPLAIYNHPLPSGVLVKREGFMGSAWEASEGTVTASADSLRDPGGRNTAPGSCLLVTACAGKHVTVTCLQSLSSQQGAEGIYTASPSPRGAANGVRGRNRAIGGSKTCLQLCGEYPNIIPQANEHIHRNQIRLQAPLGMTGSVVLLTLPWLLGVSALQ